MIDMEYIIQEADRLIKLEMINAMLDAMKCGGETSSHPMNIKICDEFVEVLNFSTRSIKLNILVPFKNNSVIDNLFALDIRTSDDFLEFFKRLDLVVEAIENYGEKLQKLQGFQHVSHKDLETIAMYHNTIVHILNALFAQMSSTFSLLLKHNPHMSNCKTTTVMHKSFSKFLTREHLIKVLFDIGWLILGG